AASRSGGHQSADFGAAVQTTLELWLLLGGLSRRHYFWMMHALRIGVGGLAGPCLAVSGSVVAAGAGDADGLGAGSREVEVVELGFGHRAVEADGFVGHGQGHGNGVVGLYVAELAGGGGDAGLAAAVDGVDGGGFGG